MILLRLKYEDEIKEAKEALKLGRHMSYDEIKYWKRQITNAEGRLKELKVFYDEDV